MVHNGDIAGEGLSQIDSPAQQLPGGPNCKRTQYTVLVRQEARPFNRIRELSYPKLWGSSRSPCAQEASLGVSTSVREAKGLVGKPPLSAAGELPKSEPAVSFTPSSLCTAGRQSRITLNTSEWPAAAIVTAHSATHSSSTCRGGNGNSGCRSGAEGLTPPLTSLALPVATAPAARPPPVGTCAAAIDECLSAPNGPCAHAVTTHARFRL